MKSIAIAIALLTVFLDRFPVIPASDEECRIERDPTKSVNLFVSSKRNHTGDWVTDFSLNKDDSAVNDTNNVTLHLSQSVTECRGRRTVHIRGVLSGISPDINDIKKRTTEDTLRFHTRCSTNVAVINDGRTARKINLEVDGHGVVFTHRPLKINEILEVKLEKKHNKFSHSLAIGVATISPMDAAQPQHINSITSTSWAMYHGNTYYNGKESVVNYGKNLNTLEVGDRVGVMRSNTGSLHFYVNGEDQGPAASNVPHPVYGLVELWGNAAMASIVE